MAKNKNKDTEVVIEETKKDEITIEAGTKVSVENAPTYSIHDAKNPSEYLTGEFFVYNDKIRNDRIRLCDDESKVNKPCMRLGWFNIKDLIIITTDNTKEQ